MIVPGNPVITSILYFSGCVYVICVGICVNRLRDSKALTTGVKDTIIAFGMHGGCEGENLWMGNKIEEADTDGMKGKPDCETNVVDGEVY